MRQRFLFASDDKFSSSKIKWNSLNVEARTANSINLFRKHNLCLMLTKPPNDFSLGKRCTNIIFTPS